MCISFNNAVNGKRIEFETGDESNRGIRIDHSLRRQPKATHNKNTNRCDFFQCDLFGHKYKKESLILLVKSWEQYVRDKCKGESENYTVLLWKI